MGYIDQYDTANNQGFRKKVSVAMATSAVSVAGEAKAAMSDVKYSKRQTLAREVLVTPSAWIEQFSLAIVQNPAIAIGPMVGIASSTNAFPIVVTTATAHGLLTGDTVRIAGHLINTAANGTWTATTVTATTFSIQETGVGVGAATGRMAELPRDVDIQTTCTGIWDDMSGVTALD